jgi:hypothetical protein
MLLILIAMFAPKSCDTGEQKNQKQEVLYQAALKSYSDALKLGMTRKGIEDYLRIKSVAFSQMCCIDEQSAYADLTKIGEQKHPWYCSAHNVYIAFQFTATEPLEKLRPSGKDSDTLKKITIFHWLEGCL